MTENELAKTISIYKKTLEVTSDNGETCFRELDKNTLMFLEELEQYQAIGAVEELQATKEKLQSYKTQMSIYAEQHKVILASDVLDMLEELDWSEGE